MNIIFCMAGLYSRFRKEGYSRPKWLLPYKNEVIISNIIRELTPSTEDKLFFIANKRDEEFLPELLHALQEFNVQEKDIVFVSDTTGQAHTASLAVKSFLSNKMNEPVLFHNIDTVLIGRNIGAIEQSLENCDGIIDVFDSISPAYSYVRLDSDEIVRDIAEKIVISRHATSGLYAFKNAQMFQDIYSRATPGREFYISDVYARMIADKMEIKICFGTDTVILGTPAEYEAWLPENQKETILAQVKN